MAELAVSGRKILKNGVVFTVKNAKRYPREITRTEEFVSNLKPSIFKKRLMKCLETDSLCRNQEADYINCLEKIAESYTSSAPPKVSGKFKNLPKDLTTQILSYLPSHTVNKIDKTIGAVANNRVGTRKNNNEKRLHSVEVFVELDVMWVKFYFGDKTGRSGLSYDDEMVDFSIILIADADTAEGELDMGYDEKDQFIQLNMNDYTRDPKEFIKLAKELFRHTLYDKTHTTTRLRDKSSSESKSSSQSSSHS
jgi:hypothetical protein